MWTLTSNLIQPFCCDLDRALPTNETFPLRHFTHGKLDSVKFIENSTRLWYNEQKIFDEHGNLNVDASKNLYFENS